MAGRTTLILSGYQEVPLGAPAITGTCGENNLLSSVRLVNVFIYYRICRFPT
ncbi:hypothetical protein K474DRAFT_1661595 [Panus rudis PR-1116 ss-1]|nr:hypothetical protein K474DRAFT_1662752 [Panus rudis PR-1116 ss-1]KAI0077505.1 hypothetical protein K474DRAFT_1661595 [Panus rudis PR-1116 ss-1]